MKRTSPSIRALVFAAITTTACLTDLVSAAPIPQVCDADLDGSGVIGFGDLVMLLDAWGPCPGCAEDIDENGVVGFSDLSFLLSAWELECICDPLPTPPDPLMAGPHSIGSLPDFNDGNVVVAAGLFPGIPDVLLQRDGSDHPGSGFWNGTGQDAIPGFDLSGRIRYPAAAPGGPGAPVAGGGPFPLVIIAHGNHTRFADAIGGDPSDENYRGYGYLQDLLATHGFISVSIDLDDFTFLFPGILARAWLVLCHIERMELLNNQAGHPLEGAIDLDRIALVGHSRGGDAVVQAQRMNAVVGGADGGPPIGPGAGEGQFAISAVWGIASTRFFDGMFNWDPVAPVQAVVPPSVLTAALPFMGMWGDADGDVSGDGDVTGDGSGDLLAAHVVGTYDGSPPGPKQLVWIHGANHNFWNTSWFDLTVPFGDDGAAAGVPNRITAAQQQDLARGYGGAFLRGHVAAEAALLDYFRFAASQVPPVPIAATAVHLQYQVREADLARVDGFETNDALDTTSEGVAGVDTSTLVGPDEIELTGARAFVPAATQSWYHNTRGLLFEWNAATDFYETVLPAGSRDVSGFEALSFRIAQDRRHAASGTEPVVRVQLEDGMGENSSVTTSTVTNIPVHQARTDDALLTKSMLKTIRLQLCLFEERNADLDLTDIRKIRFIFFSRATGQAGIDDIEFAE